MRSLKLLGVVLTMGLLAGCQFFMGTRVPTGPGPFDGPFIYESAKGLRGGGDAFTSALVGEYVSLAREQGDGEKDWPNAYIMAQKAHMAARGQVPQPEDPAAWPTIPAGERAALTDGRARLLSYIQRHANTANAQRAAHAQGLYECWLEESSEGEMSDAASCRGWFEATIREVVQQQVAPIVQNDFIVYFAWDSAALDAAAQRVIDMAAQAARGQGAARLNLVGHADRSGPTDYNLRLSLRRADAVRQALVARGIGADRMNITGVGEEQPAVATPDGVREPRNRFVSVTVR